MNTSADSHDHERKDVDAPSLFIIAFFLALSCVVIFIVVTGMMRYFKAQEPAVTAGQPNIHVTRVMEFPPPRILVRPGDSLAELLSAEEATINSFVRVSNT